jgi:MFS family permease
MSISYAGDRFQQLAQGWLVATLTHSALGVGVLTAFGTLPLLLLPIGGAIAERADRGRLLLAIQLVGAVSAALVALLVLLGETQLWQIYAWSLLNGLGTLLARPAYKVLLTEVVPEGEVRSAVAVNSVGESAALTIVNGGGGLALAWLGLPVAFLLNAGSYLAAAAGLWRLPTREHASASRRYDMAHRGLWGDLLDGVQYLAGHQTILYPLLLTFATMTLAGPLAAMLPVVVLSRGGSTVDLGILGAVMSIGGVVGAAFAAARSDGENAAGRYAAMGVLAALAVGLFVLVPRPAAALGSLAAIGFVSFAQAVWNTSRIRNLADPAYQARLQAITSMAFTLGFTLGGLWAGAAIDHVGVRALLLGAVGLFLCSAATAVAARRGVAATRWS